MKHKVFPIVIILDIVNIEEKTKFINGESNVLNTIKELPAIMNYLDGFNGDGFEKINAVYQYFFGKKNESVLNNVNLSIVDIGRDIKQECLRRVALKIY